MRNSTKVSLHTLSSNFLIVLCAAAIVCSQQVAFTQNVAPSKGNITGLVSDQDGKLLAGASIKVLTTYSGTFSDKTGQFKLEGLRTGRVYELEVSYAGFEKMIYQAQTGDVVLIKLQAGLTLRPAIITTSTEVDAWTPVAYDEWNEEEIESRNLGQDLPYLLRLSPSVVVTSDAGTGIGYTGIRVRGSDPSRINVTINGIPLNDSESQGTFWVDLPDFASSVDNIQIQRGVGTSTNGAGAFGASINLKTGHIREEAYGKISNSYGSFNTRKHSLELGTGLLGKHFTFDGRLSTVESDGFIDRATADLSSYYLSAAYADTKNLLRAIVFSGSEVTYQAWGGVPAAYLEIDSLRTYNPYTYENEVDDYQQDHYQLHYSRVLNENWNVQSALHYTKGSGFFEQFREEDNLGTYGLDPIYLGGDTITTTDLIRRRWLDNDFYGFTGSLNYDATTGVKATLGGAWNNYLGQHFGEVIWARYASNGEIRHRYYDNKADKTDFNLFAKLHWQLASNFALYGDLQYRTIAYDFKGYDEEGEIGLQSIQLGFFNPKAGLVYRNSKGVSAYTSLAVGGKEPNRSDYTESSPKSRPEAERLYDVELGSCIEKQDFYIAANLYFMYYKNQLILTGQVNDVGEYTRTNTDKSYRTGIELSGAYSRAGFMWKGNLTLSQNRILDYVAYVDNWDTWEQEEISHGDQPLSFSPQLTAGSALSYDFLDKKPTSWFSLGLLSKYVSKQYIDNSGSDLRSLDSYFVNDLQLKAGKESFWKFSTVEVNLLVRNLLNEQYESNAWVYRYIFGGTETQDAGYYPQAGVNFLVGLALGF